MNVRAAVDLCPRLLSFVAMGAERYGGAVAVPQCV